MDTSGNETFSSNFHFRKIEGTCNIIKEGDKKLLKINLISKGEGFVSFLQFYFMLF